jgi:two-component system, chemotaxis family, sensor kinase CheA
MPEMTGMELLEALRDDGRHASLPVVVVTGRASEEDRRLGADAGADAYIVKEEYDQRALLETVDRLLAG